MDERLELRDFDTRPLNQWTPWWYRPSLFFLFASLPQLLVFSFSDRSLTLSKARLFYQPRDMWVGVAFLVVLAGFSFIGESKQLMKLLDSIGAWFRREQGLTTHSSNGSPRIAEGFLSIKLDWILMAVFIVAHLIFFRGFFLDPGLAGAVLGGNLELKHDFKTIPGLTTWTQVSLLMAAIRGMRWAGVLPGEIRLVSTYHIVFFGVLLVRALLWSERLALIEGVLPFAIFIIPRFARLSPNVLRPIIQLVPFLAPFLVMVLFTLFEGLRSWQTNADGHSSLFEFGFRRIYSYYFEAMNTGSALLQISGFYDRYTWPTLESQFDLLFNQLFQKGILDIEFNNVSGIWYFCMRLGNVFVIPALAVLGVFMGVTYRFFKQGRLFGMIYPINVLLMLEILRVYYWAGSARVLPTTLVWLMLLVWSLTVCSRIRSGSGGFASGVAKHFQA